MKSIKKKAKHVEMLKKIKAIMAERWTKVRDLFKAMGISGRCVDINGLHTSRLSAKTFPCEYPALIIDHFKSRFSCFLLLNLGNLQTGIIKLRYLLTSCPERFHRKLFSNANAFPNMISELFVKYINIFNYSKSKRSWDVF